MDPYYHTPVQRHSPSGVACRQPQVQEASGKWQVEEARCVQRDAVVLRSIARKTLTVAPILLRHLRRLNGYTEAAALNIGKRFETLLSAAKTQEVQSHRLAGQLSGREGTRLEQILQAIRELRDVIEGVSREVEGQSVLVQDGVDFSGYSGAIRRLAAEVEFIASETDILALNASIEAARATAGGATFSVIAEEVRRLSERSARAAVQIGQLSSEIQRQLEDLQQSLERLSAEARANAVRASGVGEAVRARVQASTDAARQSVDRIKAGSEAIARESSAVVVSLQFQDLTRQEIEHVIQGIEGLAESARCALYGPEAQIG